MSKHTLIHKTSQTATWLSALALAVLVGPGCTVYHATETAPVPVELPDAYSSRVDATQLPERWWTSFEDPALELLVDTVLRDNLSLRQAWARVDQARTVAAQNKAAQLPTVTLNSNPQVQYLMDLESSQHQSTTTTGATIGFNYELDLWGRLRNQTNAAKFDEAATRADLEATAQSLVSQLVTLWFDRVEQGRLDALLDEQLDTAGQVLKLTEIRFSQGQATAVDVLQQRQQIASLKAQRPLIEARRKLIEHQMAVLTGRAPTFGLPQSPTAIPELGSLPALGMPSDLLRRRPDLVATERRILASDARVGVAVADRYPSFRIGASTGYQYQNLDFGGGGLGAGGGAGGAAGFFAPFIHSWVAQLTSALTAPLFDGGRRAAEVERNKARTRELVAAYGERILNALREVEDALVQERQQRAYLLELAAQLELAETTLTQARARYTDGQADFLQVLTALQSVQRVQQTEVSARRQLVGYRVRLYQALGGTWSQSLEPPKKRIVIPNGDDPNDDDSKDEQSATDDGETDR